MCGLTTMGSILGSAKLGADLEFHISIVREGPMDDDPAVNDFLLNGLLPNFVDVVELKVLLTVVIRSNPITVSTRPSRSRLDAYLMTAHFLSASLFYILL